MDPILEFQNECRERIQRMAEDETFCAQSREWMKTSAKMKYSYQFSWMGRPIIQLPTDIIGMQEVIWKTQPELIIETGIAHGGSILFSASMLQLLGGRRHVVGIDIEIREHNRREIERHPMFREVTLLEGSSVDRKIVERVYRLAEDYKRVMVVLDSNHTEAHVLAELQAYAPLVSEGCYLVVYDTSVESLPDELNAGRPWSVGDNPATAVEKFLRENPQFEVDWEMDHRLMLTNAPGGWLKKVQQGAEK